MTCIFFLFFTLLSENTFSNIDVELDVVFRDSTVQTRYLYVLCSDKNDTVAVFDTLSFNGYDRVSLFYSVNGRNENMLAMLDSGGVQFESKPFTVSPRSNIFSVIIDNRKISVEKKSYLYPVLITILFECMLIAIFARKSKSILQILALILAVAVSTFGIMAILYLTHLFW